jgi:alkanesulfonate monooxygenase SsuD/methylene tetrahydromethanopterin reductase-like flavin-dependent oxidoreductase (luciferase family)
MDPWTLITALSARTERLGLIATVSTTFTLARQFASLDHLSTTASGGTS